MSSSTMLAIREFDSYSETTTPFLDNEVVARLPWMRPRSLRNAGLKYAHPNSNVSVMFETPSSYSDFEDVNGSRGGFLDTINEQLLFASQRWVFYVDNENGHHCLKPITKNLPNFEQRFIDLKDKWYSDTEFYSSISLIQEHPAYCEILLMGVDVVPLIFRELEKGSGFWFTALKSITGQDPVDRKDRGRVKKMTQSWLLWGKEQGYKW